MKRDKYLKPFHKRMKQILKMRQRKNPATFQEIGEKFGITRQHAFTLYKRSVELFGE